MALTLTACSGSDQAEPQQSESAPRGSAPESSSSEPSGGSSSSSNPSDSESPTGNDSDTDEARDGAWELPGAGVVEFENKDGKLTLVSAEAKPGWKKQVTDESADEIEVHFTKGDTRWKIEAELDSDGLEVSREQDIKPAEAGEFEVLDAATVTFSASGEKLDLDDVVVADGWKETTRDVSSDEIEIDFTKGSAKAEFEAEFDRGQLEVEISHKVTGPAN